MLDFGSQTSHLILRRLRGLNVYAEMLPCTTKLADLPFKPKGIILSGGGFPKGIGIHLEPQEGGRLANPFPGPSSVYDEGSPRKTLLMSIPGSTLDSISAF